VNDFPHVAPSPDGLQRAFADARGRRWRKAGLSTSTVAGGLAVLALVAGGQGTQSLVQQPSPQQPAVSRLVPDGTQPLPSTSRPNQGQGVQVYGSDQQRRLSGGQATGTTPGGSLRRTSSGTTPGAPAIGPHYAAGPISRSDYETGYLPMDTTCAVPAEPNEQPPLCTSANAPYATAAPYDLQALVCSYRTGLTLLHYTGRNEVDLKVLAKGHEVWRWSRWHPDGGSPHTIGVEANSCTAWTFSWTGVDNQGRTLPKGSYTLQATFLAGELAQERTATTTFTIG